MKELKDFCTNCRKHTPYHLTKQSVVEEIRGTEYDFNITVAICEECGAEMSIPGLIDENIKEIDEQYRSIEGIISTSDIDALADIYNIGKAPLSMALGFGEVTIGRYCAGQIPSKEYSDVMKKAIASPKYMKKLLATNKDKITDTAYKKALTAANEMEELLNVSPQMLKTIARIFENLREVTPLMLQKILYYIQGIALSVKNMAIFPEDCEAWVHGPVYPQVYKLFKDFKYNPIEDKRFAAIRNIQGELDDNTKHIIDLVTSTFGMYGGKALELITHNEEPWANARKGYGNNTNSNTTIDKESIKDYFDNVRTVYEISLKKGAEEYIEFMFSKAYEKM